VYYSKSFQHNNRHRQFETTDTKLVSVADTIAVVIWDYPVLRGKNKRSMNQFVVAAKKNSVIYRNIKAGDTIIHTDICALRL
jgi:hypothetical protein